MKIAIDATRAVIEKAGIGRGTKELVKNLIKADKKNQYLLLFSYFRKDPAKVREIQAFQAPKVKIKTYKIPGSFKEAIWGWQAPWFDRLLEGADIFLAPSFFEVNLGAKTPQIVLVHDLTTILFPKQRGEEISQRLSKRLEKACKLATKIIAISESTKRDLIRLLKIPAEKIEVIYWAPTKVKEMGQLPKGLKTKSYILFVGTIEPRKNLVGLFRAYGKLPPSLQQKYPLVVVGAQGWNTGETYKVLRDEKLEDKVKFLGYVDDKTLAKLYQAAAVSIYPSLYEGFGLPIVEAMSYGTPVITSDTSSMPEAAGRAGVFVDPTNPKSIARALQRVLEGEIKVLSSDLKAQAARFSWEKAARETLRLLESIK